MKTKKIPEEEDDSYIEDGAYFRDVIQAVDNQDHLEAIKGAMLFVPKKVGNILKSIFQI
jgi:hypothetical protein